MRKAREDFEPPIRFSQPTKPSQSPLGVLKGNIFKDGIFLNISGIEKRQTIEEEAKVLGVMLNGSGTGVNSSLFGQKSLKMGNGNGNMVSAGIHQNIEAFKNQNSKSTNSSSEENYQSSNNMFMSTQSSPTQFLFVNQGINSTDSSLPLDPRLSRQGSTQMSNNGRVQNGNNGTQLNLENSQKIKKALFHPSDINSVITTGNQKLQNKAPKNVENQLNNPQLTSMFNPILDYLKNLEIDPKVNQEKHFEKPIVNNTPEMSPTANSTSKANLANRPKQSPLNFQNSQPTIKMGLNSSMAPTDTSDVFSKGELMPQTRDFDINEGKSLGYYINSWRQKLKQIYNEIRRHCDLIPRYEMDRYENRKIIMNFNELQPSIQLRSEQINKYLQNVEMRQNKMIAILQLIKLEFNQDFNNQFHKLAVEIGQYRNIYGQICQEINQRKDYVKREECDEQVNNIFRNLDSVEIQIKRLSYQIDHYLSQKIVSKTESLLLSEDIFGEKYW